MTHSEFSYSLHRLSGSLKPFALKLTRDQEDAKDLLQDTLVKAFVHRDKFTEGTNMKAWLYTIMKNTFLTNYQRMLRRGTFVDPTDNLYYLNSSSTQVENGVIGKFVMEDILSALKGLEHVYSQPFTLYFSGYKYREIARQLEVPIGTVKNRIHIARKLLKSKLSVY